MGFYDVVQILFFIAVLFSLSPILGQYFYKVLETDESLVTQKIGIFERFIYRLCGISIVNQNWRSYLASVLVLNFAGFLLLFAILMTQSYLPLNPQSFPNLTWHLAFNTAISFITNTNWQSYGGESTLSQFSQMFGLGVQNFISASVGFSVLLAFARALKGHKEGHLGNFWKDLTRVTLYILLPLSIAWSALHISEGMIQTFGEPVKVATLEGEFVEIPVGPVASQVAIKQLGSNGGGYFNTNSAHPLENPTPFTNFLSTLALLLIAGASCFTFGLIVGSPKQGLVLFGVMSSLFVISLGLSLISEFQGAPISAASQLMEGKEVRFGVTNSILYSVATTAASNGSVNAMMSSLTPLAGGLAMLNMMLGEVVFGGVGSGLYGMILFAIMTVFIAGLMVGRTPEYLGKKIEAKEILWTLIGCVLPGMTILIFTAIGLFNTEVISGLSAKGPHAFSEVLYAFTSAAANNGSAFAGLTANLPTTNVMLGVAMLIGRFGVIIPVMIIAGAMIQKKSVAESIGTFRTDSFIFGFLLIMVILLVGALTFFPALALGPILEHLLMSTGILL